MASTYRIVGTAGHIDHGKSSLVRALTGIDPDRLQEEKERGITIDLGFADVALGPLHVGFIDVPGHERFVKNMLAGIGGIDAVLLVVAGDESIMPQTREHFAIARLLGVTAGVVAITKADTTDAETLEIVEMEVEELLDGTPLGASPMVRTSVIDGRGLELLRQRLVEVLDGRPPRPADGLLRLPVDRVFSVHGFGTVVTGTLLGGEVRPGARLEVVPGGKVVNVRGVQVHGRAAEVAFAGQRTALNLQGIAVDELQRGVVLAHPGSLPATSMIDVQIEMLPGMRLRHLQRVRFHHGAAEVLGRIALLQDDLLEEGSTGLAQLRLESPYPVTPGDRFILRRYSPTTTIAGGVVVDAARRRHRRTPGAAARVAALLSASPGQRLAQLVREAGLEGLEPAEAARRLGMPEALLPPVIEQAGAAGGVATLKSPPRLLWAEALATLQAGIEQAIGAYHQRWPLRPAMPKEELRQQLRPRPSTTVLDAAAGQLQDSERVRADADGLALAGHVVRLGSGDSSRRARLLERYESAGLAPPATDEAVGDDVEQREVFHHLLRAGELVRIRDELVLHHEVLDRLVDGMTARFARGSQFSVADFKDWAGISRRHAIPLLEHLDSRRITRRVGDLRERL